MWSLEWSKCSQCSIKALDTSISSDYRMTRWLKMVMPLIKSWETGGKLVDEPLNESNKIKQWCGTPVRNSMGMFQSHSECLADEALSLGIVTQDVLQFWMWHHHAISTGNPFASNCDVGCSLLWNFSPSPEQWTQGSKHPRHLADKGVSMSEISISLP